jgi:hypothetical protein
MQLWSISILIFLLPATTIPTQTTNDQALTRYDKYLIEYIAILVVVVVWINPVLQMALSVLLNT